MRADDFRITRKPRTQTAKAEPAPAPAPAQRAAAKPAANAVPASQNGPMRSIDAGSATAIYEPYDGLRSFGSRA